MVAHAIRTDSNARGARPFDPARDLTGVARLLEEAFRSEHTFPLSTTPVLRELGIVLWTLSYAPVFPDNVTGFVWLEKGQIVGNVTISQDDRLDRYMISNVAVKPEYRRQGIARALMQTAVDHLRDRGARWALLNVRPTNSAAVDLYRRMGFTQVETRGEWSRSHLTAPPSLPPPGEFGQERGGGAGGRGVRSQDQRPGEGMRPLHSYDHRAVTALIRAAAPANAHQFHSARLTEFDPNWEDLFTELLSDFFAGQVTRRWVVERQGRLAAVMMVRGQRFLSPHRIAVQVHPDFRGQVEEELLARALGDLQRFPRREIRAAGSSTHPELIAVLEQHGFQFVNGLMLMALAL